MEKTKWQAKVAFKWDRIAALLHARAAYITDVTKETVQTALPIFMARTACRVHAAPSFGDSLLIGASAGPLITFATQRRLRVTIRPYDLV